MTKKENFVAIQTILNDCGHGEFDEFINHEIDLLSRKRSKSSKPTKRQIENEQIKGKIEEVLLRAESGMSAGDITRTIGEESATPNRVIALLTQMKKDGTVIRQEVKGKAMFSIA